ncbi:TetR/AcrR family transcriptional regulator [Cellulomonas sp. WB94]|uniref:TetR/AcrR family transcriptional regulator n=1 Tax=Cellulomonas sp. WB94 TaxID=2173174 RepID=UPI000D5670DD|nr:TetR/AcrR family transcriptional regulator [Cellulomonas sp. WB94]PVU83825.1 TetR/AcrR family transcriptional regulator [Cellulomonas sp. WB94]
MATHSAPDPAPAPPLAPVPVATDPTQPRRDTRGSIVDAAVALIADRGFSATSVDDIAAAAGVAKGSIYYNFGSKTALFEAVIVEGVDRLTAALRASVDGLDGPAAIEAIVTELLVQVQAHPDFAKLVVAEVFRTGRDWQHSIRQVREESMAVFADVVRATWPDRDPSLTAAVIFGATLVAGLEWLAFQPHRTAADVRSAVLATVLPA